MRILSQLLPRRFHSATNVWSLSGGNEDNDLWALTEITEIPGHPAKIEAVTSVFVPTDEQRKQIADGVNIALTVLGVQPPVMLRLTDEPLGKAPVDNPEEDDTHADA